MRGNLDFLTFIFMKRLSRIALIVLFGVVLLGLDMPWSGEETFYSTGFPVAEEGVWQVVRPVHTQAVQVDFLAEEEGRLDYVINLGSEVKDSYHAYVAEKVKGYMEKVLRQSGLGEDLVNIYTAESGEDYVLTLEVMDEAKVAMVKEMVPSEFDFQNGWWAWLQNNKIRLGLDLQGGAQLDYLVDLSQVDPDDYQSVLNGNLAVVEQRVNRLGVSEPNIYLSQVGTEEHIVVELAGVFDLDEAKKTIGKTVQLEFKEPRPDGDEPSDVEIMEQAEKALAEAKGSSDDFRLVGLKYQGQGSDEGVNFEETGLMFADELSPVELGEEAAEMEVGEIYDGVLQASAGMGYDYATGQLYEVKGFYVFKVVDEDMAEHEVVVEEAQEEEVTASHILVAYAGSGVSDEITRTKEEAKKLAEGIVAEVKAEGADFAEIAKEKSDDASSADKGGDLGAFGRGKMVEAFENAAFNMEVGEISEPVESEFGYHIIKVTAKQEPKEAVKEVKEERRVNLQVIEFPLEVEPWVSTELDGTHFKHASVQLDETTFEPYVAIQFDDEGATMFGDLTERLKGQQLAIFVGGELISAPNVNERIGTGSAIITGSFDLQSATALANNLNSGAIPAPLILANQNNVPAQLGAEARDSSLWAGILGLIIVAIYMVLYYRLPGLIADISLLFYAGILIFFVKFSAMSGFPVVLTLAGVAGIILSIGMAVDANILIFERLKEEMRSGKNLSTAIAVGFERAWSSIRDANISTFLICAVLYLYGASVIRGFALMLALGVAISMFTAITLTRGILKLFVRTGVSKNRWLFGDRRGSSEGE